MKLKKELSYIYIYITVSQARKRIFANYYNTLYDVPPLYTRNIDVIVEQVNTVNRFNEYHKEGGRPSC